MPYYLYKISSQDGMDLVKQLELLGVHDAFRDAKKEAKRLRADLPLKTGSYKLMFAETQLEAEEKLLEKREKPVLMEHER
jgi:hypothetical protein